MKVKVISRNPDEYIRETKQDINKGNDFSIETFPFSAQYLREQSSNK